jgi:DNA-binding transcriptional ArsR family regulator
MDSQRQLLFERHAAICQVFSNRVRLELLDALREGELTVGELAERVGASPSNVSQHLTLMRERGAVTSRRDGANVHYGVTDPRIFDAFDLMRTLLLDQIRSQGQLADLAAAEGRLS